MLPSLRPPHSGLPAAACSHACQRMSICTSMALGAKRLVFPCVSGHDGGARSPDKDMRSGADAAQATAQLLYTVPSPGVESVLGVWCSR
eukprot:136668-Chlamydomonas_euryale.AAC.6